MTPFNKGNSILLYLLVTYSYLYVCNILTYLLSLTLFRSFSSTVLCSWQFLRGKWSFKRFLLVPIVFIPHRSQSSWCIPFKRNVIAKRNNTVVIPLGDQFAGVNFHTLSWSVLRVQEYLSWTEYILIYKASHVSTVTPSHCRMTS